MRRLPMGMLAAVAALWCAQAVAQHHMPGHRPAPAPVPPGTTLNNTPGLTNRGPGGGGPWGTETVDPRCATSVVCGPNQTAAPGGPSLLNNQNIGPVTEKPRLGGPATAVEANRQRLIDELADKQERLNILSSAESFEQFVERKEDRLSQELQSLLAGTHVESKIAASVRDRIAAVQADLATFQNARDDTTNPEMRERYVAAIADLTRVLGLLGKELRDAERRVAERTAELRARRDAVRAENAKSWEEARVRLVGEVASLRARLGIAPATGESLTADLINLLGQ